MKLADGFAVTNSFKHERFGGKYRALLLGGYPKTDAELLALSRLLGVKDPVYLSEDAKIVMVITPQQRMTAVALGVQRLQERKTPEEYIRRHARQQMMKKH